MPRSLFSAATQTRDLQPRPWVTTSPRMHSAPLRRFRLPPRDSSFSRAEIAFWRWAEKTVWRAVPPGCRRAASANMRRRKLGRTGLEVSEISLGTVEIGMDYGIGAGG